MRDFRNIDDLMDIAMDKIDVVNSVNNKISEVENDMINAIQSGQTKVEVVVHFYEYQFIGMDQKTSSLLVAYFIISNLKKKKYKITFGRTDRYIYINIFLDSSTTLTEKLNKFFNF